MTAVLFVCTRNRYRSPLAAAFFRQLLYVKKAEGGWVVDSAGTWTQTGLPPLPEAVWLSRKYGLDIEQHRSKQVSEEILSRFDLVLCMEAGHKEALRVEFPLLQGGIYCFSEAVENRVYDIPDPFAPGGRIDDGIGEEIYKLIQAKHDNVVQLARRVMGARPDRRH